MNQSAAVTANLLTGLLLIGFAPSHTAEAQTTTSVTRRLNRYDPLQLSGGPLPKPLDLSVSDARRTREIPIRVYLPAAGRAAPAPVVLFSHGLGGSREGSAFLGRHWAGRGYAAVFVQHPGSDVSIWRDKPRIQRRKTLEDAANAANFSHRVADIPAVLDQLTSWTKSKGHPLEGRFDMSRVAMSGHSFGAVTTQAVSGQRFPGVGARLTDPRIRAAILMSPSSPRAGSPADAFAGVNTPWLLMTGTRDTSPIGGQNVKSRLAVFAALPPGRKYELVLDQAQHSVFTDRPLATEGESRNPNHHRVILALTTAFLDTYLRDDPEAANWLNGAGPKTVLEPADRWQTK